MDAALLQSSGVSEGQPPCLVAHQTQPPQQVLLYDLCDLALCWRAVATVVDDYGRVGMQPCGG